MKIRSEIAFFSNKRHFEIWFEKTKTITLFRRKLSKVHKTDTILHEKNYIFRKTRANKNKQWTHLGALKGVGRRLSLINVSGQVAGS